MLIINGIGFSQFLRFKCRTGYFPVRTSETPWHQYEYTNGFPVTFFRRGFGVYTQYSIYEKTIVRVIDGSTNNCNEEDTAIGLQAFHGYHRASKFTLKLLITKSNDTSEGIQHLTSRRLIHPVTIPPRRPKQRDRDFVRAYAPDLSRCDIDQVTFLDFLDGFNAVLASSHWIGAANLAGAVTGAVPSIIASGVGLVVRVAAGVYKEVQSRKIQNAYLLKKNEEFFQPRDLIITHLNLGEWTQNRADTSEPCPRNDGVTGEFDNTDWTELVYFTPNNASEVESDFGDDDNTRESGIARFSDKHHGEKDVKAQLKYNPNSAIGTLLSPNVPNVTQESRERGEEW
ncbi:hypothetical protein K504DRAFT_497131 [Pleomassaria siparia CBS 279.74]|uniref:Uncharacterized protein n=1 Tax=Pleomassaria siparia CBS 279.74 TaxID=1314801 RepID=A0A6G1KQT7_9PLEO|nr:hypothetical protein K504DRAFT_497131 [Pleomassaria siparia CBS 279.74]